MGNRGIGPSLVARGIAILGVLACPAWAGHEMADLEAIENAFVALAEKVSPSVVAIETKVARKGQRAPGSRGGPMIGSGVVIDAGGLIVTNDHVIRNADEVLVTIDGGRRFSATVVSRDSRSDLAVIKIPAQHLVPAQWGNLDEVRAGQWALAMGNPFGLGKYGRFGLSYGIVSALGISLRALEEDGAKYYGNLIQTTADINPGNSGGPLFNIRGQVIGISTAMETRSGVSEGLGFAIPISRRTLGIIEVLARGQQVEYGFLGVNIVDATDDARRVVGSANCWGVTVTRVFADSPAAEAGLRDNDLILRYDATYVRDADHLIRLVGATPVGEVVPLEVFRHQQKLQLQAAVGKREVSLAGGR